MVKGGIKLNAHCLICDKTMNKHKDKGKYEIWLCPNGHLRTLRKG